MEKIELLAIAIAAFVSSTAYAVPRYSAPMTQVDGSSNDVTVKQVRDNKQPQHNQNGEVIGWMRSDGTTTDGTKSAKRIDQNAYGNQGNTGSRLVGPNETMFVIGPKETIFAGENGKLKRTSSGDGIVRDPSGQVIGDESGLLGSQWGSTPINATGNEGSRTAGEVIGKKSIESNPAVIGEARNQSGSVQNSRRGSTLIDNKRIEHKSGNDTASEFCVGQRVITTKEANRIAYEKTLYFSSHKENELSITLGDKGDIIAVNEGDEHEVSSQVSGAAYIKMHSHPHDRNGYSRWPSWMDVKGACRATRWIKSLMKEQGCPQDRDIYHYIVCFDIDSGFVGKDDGRKIYINAGRTLLRFDLNGVYRVLNENGDEEVCPPPEFLNDKGILWCSVLQDHVDIMLGKRDPEKRPVNHSPFRYTPEDVATVVKEVEEDQRMSGPIDVNEALRLFHAEFISKPNSLFPWRRMQAYLYVIAHLGANDGKGKRCWPAETVGVRGWCKCTPYHLPPASDLYPVGTGVWDAKDESIFGCALHGDVCESCGRCYAYRRAGDDSDEVRFWNQPFEQFIRETIPQTYKMVAARIKMEDAILSIPEGEIVIPLTRICSCDSEKKRTLVTIDERRRLQICYRCGGIYVPDGKCAR